MKIYTKKGDTGETGLIGGKRVAKDHIRVAAYGHVDELNAAVGFALVACADAALATELRRIQSDLFTIGAELAADDGTEPQIGIDVKAVERLESRLDHAWEQLPKLNHFVLPGGSESAARLHLARTVCRRAERAVVELSKNHRVGESVIPYLNRLSDLLFAYARIANKLNNSDDIIWVAPEKSA